MRGRLKDLTIGLNGEQHLGLVLLGDFREEYKKLKDQPVDIAIKKHRALRSRDANAYCWVLIGKIAESTNPPMDKDAVYLDMLQHYGQGGQVAIPTAQFHLISRELDYYKILGEGHEHGIPVTYVHMWVGSSKYDSKEMATFIDGIIQEARDLGIDTDTPEEIRRFKERWAGK
jgi:hypothetical protein